MIYLASTSPRRKRLLREAGISYKVLKPPYREHPLPARIKPQDIVRDHALGKALSVVPQVRDGVIIGSDTVVYHGASILGKPRNRRHAGVMLSRLQGQWHTVYTGVALLQVSRGIVLGKKLFYEKTRVRLKKMTAGDILRYFGRINPLDKAGSYAIQAKETAIIEETRGSFSNAVGLPLEKLCVTLKPFLRPAPKKANHR